jgi:hypothetical protein
MRLDNALDGAHIIGVVIFSTDFSASREEL